MARTLALVLVALLAACGSRSDLTADEDGGLGAPAGGQAAEPEECVPCNGKINGTEKWGMMPTCPGEATVLHEAFLACACREDTCLDDCYNLKGPGPFYEICGPDEHGFMKYYGCTTCLREKCGPEYDACRANKPTPEP